MNMHTRLVSITKAMFEHDIEVRVIDGEDIGYDIQILSVETIKAKDIKRLHKLYKLMKPAPIVNVISVIY